MTPDYKDRLLLRTAESVKAKLRDSDVMSFYETLALVMQEKGINAAYVSAKSGISRSYFSKLKSGRIKDVTWGKALLILEAIGISPDEFARKQSGGGAADS